LAALALSAHAQDKAETTWGFELEFKNRQMRRAETTVDEFGEVNTNTWANEEVQNRWQKIMRARCSRRGDCKVLGPLLDKHSTPKFPVYKFRVQYNDGWYYDITLDPKTLEIVTGPITTKQVRASRERLREDIFDLAKKDLARYNLTIFSRWGSGHVHVGFASTFEKNPRLFRNWLVDLNNHPEVFSGGVGDDYPDAPTMNALGEDAQKEFAKVIQEFDEGKITTSQALAEAVERRVYPFQKKRFGYKNLVKYHAINLTKVVDPKMPPHARTVELRGIRAHRDVDEMLRSVNLIQGHLDYLAKVDSPIQFVIQPARKKAADAARGFKEFVEKSGQDWADFYDDMPKRWKKLVAAPGPRPAPPDCPTLIADAIESAAGAP
jgi:hypothetical protein